MSDDKPINDVKDSNEVADEIIELSGVGSSFENFMSEGDEFLNTRGIRVYDNDRVLEEYQNSPPFIRSLN